MQDELAFAYLLRCRNGSLYAGWTDDLAARLHAHKSGAGARYTRGFGAAGLAGSSQAACVGNSCGCPAKARPCGGRRP